MKSYSNDSEIKESIKLNVKKYGCHISLIKSDGYNPSFGYTVGLVKEYNHPEVIVLGFDIDSAHSILSIVLNEIKNGVHFKTGTLYDGFLEEYKVQFVKMKKAHYPDYLGYAGWYNDNSWNFDTIQLIWPDKNSNFPYDESFSKSLKYIQPLLDRNEHFKFLEEKNLDVYITDDILCGGVITHVYHNKDGSWQFFSSDNPSLDEVSTISLAEVVKHDLSLNEIYYLNLGEAAYRDKKSNDWVVDTNQINKSISNLLK